MRENFYEKRQRQGVTIDGAIMDDAQSHLFRHYDAGNGRLRCCSLRGVIGLSYDYSPGFADYRSADPESPGYPVCLP